MDRIHHHRCATVIDPVLRCSCPREQSWDANLEAARLDRQEPVQATGLEPVGVFDPDCYICKDPEFELLGLPLCRYCPVCAMKGSPGHIPADDTRCSVCGFDEE